MRRHRCIAIALVGFAATILGVAGACGGQQQSSAIAGNVVMTAKASPGAPPPPASFMRIRVLQRGAVVTETRTGEDGRFRVDVADGSYTVEGEGPTSPVQVVVKTGRVAHVTLVEMVK